MVKIQLSTGWTTQDYITGLTEQEAIEICEDHNWEYYDENEFCWGMNIVDDYEYEDRGSYSPSAPWNAPGMKVSDFIR